MQLTPRPALTVPTLLLILFGALVGATAAVAQFSPCQAMPESQKFTVSQAGGGRVPDVAMFPDGRAIVVYQTGSSPGSDDDRLGVVARFIGANGQFEGNEFQVNTLIDQDQMNAEVAVAPNGAFVVVWVSDVSPGDMDVASIRARVYAPNGSPVGEDFRVNDVAEGWQENPRVAMNNDGFVVVFDTNGPSPGNDASGHSIQARRFDADGTPLGGQFQVNTVIGGDQYIPDVAMHPDGRFVVVWQSDTSGGDDNSSRSVQVRRYSSSGTPLAPEQQLNIITAQAQDKARVSMDFADASFMVAWQSGSSEDGDDEGLSIQARGMLWNGIPTTQREFQVNQETLDGQFNVNIANVGPREYTAVWVTDYSGDRTLAMRSIGLEGAEIGGEIDLSGSALRPQDANIASNGNGSSLTVHKESGLDDVVPTNRDGIRARRWNHPCATGEPGDCVEDATTLCLLDNRFRITANYRTPQGEMGAAQAVELTPDTGYFWFFRQENVEMVIKVLNGCPINQRFWVIAGGLTNVEVDIEVFDIEANQSRLFGNPQATPFQPIQDTNAFATCP